MPRLLGDIGTLCFSEWNVRDGSLRSHDARAGRGRDRQPRRGCTPPQHAGRHGEPQGYGARSALALQALRSLGAKAETHRCGFVVRRGPEAYPGRSLRGRAGRLGRVREPDRRAHRDRARRPRAHPRRADSGRFLAVPYFWLFGRDEADVAITVHPRLVVSTVETACDAACAGMGLTRAFSYHVEAAVEAGILATVLDAYRPPALPISFVYGAGRFLPIKVRAFLDFASPRLKARLAK